MRIRIAEINFAFNRVWLEVVDGDDGGGITRLDALLAIARARGLADVRVHHRVGRSHLMRRALNEVVDRHAAMLTRDHGWSDSPTPNSLSSIATTGSTLMYSMRFDDLDHVVERIGTAVLMIGAAADLDDIACNRLRFCVHELAVNTFEHGTFDAPPQIRVGIQVYEDVVKLAYRDNAAPFVTNDPTSLDVAGKIERGERRGLGLYILNQMGKSMSYVRAGQWNVTTLTASLNRISTSSNRRHSMDGISIEVVPCKLPSTVILKPMGSIDSSTAQVVQTHLDGAIEQGNVWVVVDFSAVEFVSSAGVGIFLGTVSRLRQAGGDLVFMCVPKQIQEVFDIINLKSYFRTIESTGELETIEQS